MILGLLGGGATKASSWQGSSSEDCRRANWLLPQEMSPEQLPYVIAARSHLYLLRLGLARRQQFLDREFFTPNFEVEYLSTILAWQVVLALSIGDDVMEHPPKSYAPCCLQLYSSWRQTLNNPSHPILHSQPVASFPHSKMRVEA